jgi:cholesterol transport system auxiliary component
MRKLVTVILLAATTALVGCSPLNMPPKNEYTLVSKKVAYSNRPSRSNKTLLVSMPVAAPGFQTRDMMYVLTPFELQSYTQSQWVAPPASMLSTVLVNAVRGTNYFKAVAAPPFVGNTDYQLNTYLVALDQSFMRPTSRVHLALSVTLVKTSTRQVLATKTFVRNVDAPGNNAYSGVIAANKAAAWVSKQVARFVVRAAH